MKRNPGEIAAYISYLSGWRRRPKKVDARDPCFHSCNHCRVWPSLWRREPHLALHLLCAFFLLARLTWHGLCSQPTTQPPTCQLLRAKAQSPALGTRRTFATECKISRVSDGTAYNANLYTCSITLHNQQQCHLLCLPAELRNAIYAFALGGNELYAELSSGKFRVLPDNNIPWMRASNTAGTWVCVTHFLALTATCRQIRSETSLLPFALNTFSLGTIGTAGCIFERRTDGLTPTQRANIRHIRITVQSPERELPTATKLCRRIQDL